MSSSQPSRTQFTMIVTIIMAAVLTAVGIFLAWSFFQRRPDLPEGTFITTVEGVDVLVSMDPAQRVRLLNPPLDQPVTVTENQTPVPTPEQPAVQPSPPPTDTPAPPPPTATPLPEAVIFINYVVQPNDTMYSVSRRIDTSIALMAQEGIAQDNLIPGQTIRLPIGNPAYCPGRRPYAVGEGDTAYSISRRFNITPDELRAINNLDANYTVRSATVICVP